MLMQNCSSENTPSRKCSRRSRAAAAMAALALLLVLPFLLSGCGAVVTTDTGTAQIEWSAPASNEDGTPLTALAGYKVYFGTAPGVYDSVDVGDVNSYVLLGLTKGKTYYFTVTAYDTEGNESDYSSMVSKNVS